MLPPFRLLNKFADLYNKYAYFVNEFFYFSNIYAKQTKYTLNEYVQNC
jgi:hypothetical protein